MHLTFKRALGATLATLVIVLFICGFAGYAARLTAPPIPDKPPGLVALEAAENRDFQDMLASITFGGPIYPVDLVPIDPNAPDPASTRLYNNLLDNLLSSLHYYYKLSPDSPAANNVTAWNAENGERMISTAFLFSVENHVNWLLTLELYTRLHSKAVFDEDLEYARERVEALFTQDWHPVAEWPLGIYFDLVYLHDLTGEQKYLDWAYRYAAGDGPDDFDTPLTKARGLAHLYQYNRARMASPFYFYFPALIADYSTRFDDPALMTVGRSFFVGLKDMLYDDLYKMLWKQASVASDGSTSINIIQTFDTLEQLSAIRAILEYGRASGDPEALDLARAILSGIWDADAPMLIEAPEGFLPGTYFGVYTAYDVDREAERFDETEVTIDQILLYNVNVMLNEYTRGEFRDDVDFLTSWMELSGPLYHEDANGFYIDYGENWVVPEHRMVSAKAAIWMARSLAQDEWYRYQRVQSLTESGFE